MNKPYDIIVIGAGSGGLSAGIFMAKAGFKVMMVSRTAEEIGGECLNDGCVPSKALIHVSRIVHNANSAAKFGLNVSGNADIKKVLQYVYSKQNIIREHENETWLKEQGIEVVLGTATFSGKDSIDINGKNYYAKKIVIATGSKPVKLRVPGVEQILYYDNENIFHIEQLPARLLMVGGGPIGIEISQAFQRLGSRVTIIDSGNNILMHDDESVTGILLDQLKSEGIKFIFNSSVEKFTSPNEAIIAQRGGDSLSVQFDAVFVGIGRELHFEKLRLENAGIELKDHKILVDAKLRTTNKNVFVCGDAAGNLQFSHAAEQHGRLLINNFLSPFKNKLNNDHMSWVTFTDPEVATFGLNEKQLQKRKISFRKIESSFEDDDRAVVDSSRYGRLILFINEKGFLRKQKILGGTMVAPNAGELIQELILANKQGLSINAIFNKIYPYPVASRINQKVIVQYKQEGLTDSIKKLLQWAFKIFS